ncbi:MAG: rhomboid family intramembrane serine protease [Bacteroidia bacterium]|nr:rhomboid family intramembrane serine protease [Bacteroidia bacterium]
MSQFSLQQENPNTGVVKTLIIINVACWLRVQAGIHFFNFDVTDSLALYNYNSDKFRPWQLFSYMFLHDISGFMHIFFNMLGLWMFGTVLERHWGSKRFLSYYMITGIGAGIISMVALTWQLNPMYEGMNAYLANPGYSQFELFVSENMPGSYQNEQVNAFLKNWYYDQANPMYISESIKAVMDIGDMRLNTATVGASGSIFGLLLAFGMLFPNSMVMLLIPPIPMKAKYFVIIFGAIELFSGLRNNIDDNVGHFAHLGGMLFGLILILLWRKKDRANSPYQPYEDLNV